LVSSGVVLLPVLHDMSSLSLVSVHLKKEASLLVFTDWFWQIKDLFLSVPLEDM